MAGSVEELLHSYNAEYSALDAKKEQLSNQIEAIQEQINAMQKQINAIQEQRNSIDLPDWVDVVMKPLAEQLAEKVGNGWKAVVWGPYGLHCKVTVNLVKDPDVSVAKQHSLGLTVWPCPDYGGNLRLLYETGEVDNTKYPKGSLGEFNGGNMVTALLPNTIDEIVPLLHSYVPISLRKEEK